VEGRTAPPFLIPTSIVRTYLPTVYLVLVGDDPTAVRTYLAAFVDPESQPSILYAIYSYLTAKAQKYGTP
jgi:hypothetical protein